MTLWIIFYKSQIEDVNFLLYTYIMKKFFISMIILSAVCGSVMADETNDRIRILYAENNIKDAFNVLLSIPEDNRTSENWLLMGNIMQDEGRVDDAVLMYNHAIASDEKNYKAHYNLGNIYFDKDNMPDAVSEYKKAVKYKPDFAYGYYNIGCAYLKQGKFKDAKWQFYKAIDLNNQVADFHYNLAYTFKQLNNEKQAKVYLEYYNKLFEREQ